MANRVRGIRQTLPANVMLGRGPGTTGPAQALPLNRILAQHLQDGTIPLPGPSLTPIADKNILANLSGSTALATGHTLTAILDDILGTAEGDIVQRGAAVWQVLAPGANGQVLTSGGASALNSWQTPTVVAFNSRGAWSGTAAYNPFDVVTFNGSAYVNYAAISAPAAGITLDASATSYTNSAAPTVALTTAQTNDIIVIVVQAVSFSASPSVSSITDTVGLTWALHKQYQFTPGFPGTNGYSDTEIWWAKSTGALTSDTITVNMAATDNVALTAFGLHGAYSLTSPFDPNASIPVTNSNSTSGNPSVSGLSTSLPGADGVLIFTEMTSANGGGFAGTVSGFTIIGTPHGGSVSGAVVYQHITGNVTSDTITSSETAPYWSAIGTCVDGGAVANTSPDQDDSHWLSQGNVNTVDSRFALSAGQLQLATIASGNIIGNSGAGTAEPVSTTLSAVIDRALGSTQGDILYRGASGWAVLAPGTTGGLLQTGGSGANPSWEGPGQVVGVSSNTAAIAGNVGEYVSAIVGPGSPVALTSSVAANVTSISLTAGDWDVAGICAFAPGAAVTVQTAAASIALASASFPALTNSEGYSQLPGGNTGFNISLTVGPFIERLNATTTIYLNAESVYTGAAGVNATGLIRARRMR